MSSLQCVIATEADGPRLFVWMHAFYAEEKLAFNSDCESALNELLRNKELGQAVVLHRSDVNVGYFLLTYGFSIERGGKTALLDELYILPNARGQGMGKAAVAEAQRLAKEAHCTAIFVEVDRSNERAQSLYKKSGFTDLGRDYLAAQL